MANTAVWYHTKLPQNLTDIILNDINNLKPSRTQRAMNAKNDRLSNKVHPPEGNKNNENDDFTSDGIEALKPFESSLNKENSRSS